MVRKLKLLLFAVNFIFLFLAPQSLWAVCSSPAGEAGQILFQTPNLTFCDGTNWIALGSGGGSADNMGNHTASQNIVLGTNWLSGDGANEGIFVDSNGFIGINTNTIVTPLTVNGALSTNIVDIAAGTTTLDLAQSNFFKVAFTGNLCGGLTLNNIVEGTTYTIATNGVTAGTCSFSSAGLTFSYAPQNSAIANDAIYTMMKVGTTVYVSWLNEFDAPAASGVVNVTGTAPISSSGGTNPDISISQATTSTNGYLSSADWNTFNNKIGLSCSTGQVPYYNGTNWVCEDTTASNTANTILYRDGSGDFAASTITMEDALVGNGTTSLQVALNTPAGAGSYSLTLPTNDGNANEFLQTNGAGVLTWAAASGGGGADNMGNHTASQNIILGSNWLSGDGGNEGISVDSTGKVGIGRTAGVTLDAQATSNNYVARLTSDQSSSFILFDNTGSTGSLEWVGTRGDSVVLGTSANDRLTVDSAGKVGIGTAAPARLLHVDGPMRLTASTTPASPVAGDVFIDSAASNVMKYYNGSSWVSLTAGGGGDFMKDGSVAMTGAFRAANGNGAAPSISFSSDADSGLYSIGNNLIGISVGGTTRFRFNGSAFQSFSAGGADIGSALGTSAGPTYAFNGDSNTGMYNASADQLGFSTNSTERMRIDDSGNVGIGTPSPARKLHVNGPMRLTASATPGSPAAGDVYIDSGDSNKLKYHNGTGWVTLEASGGGADNMGNHTASQNIVLGSHWLSGDGGNEGISIDSNGRVGIGTTSLSELFQISGPNPAVGLTETGSSKNFKIKATSTGISFLDGFTTYYQFNTNGTGLGLGTSPLSGYNITLPANAIIGSTRGGSGNMLSLSANGISAGTTNGAGGKLVLSSGISTGTGTSIIELRTASAGGSGTSDNTPSTKMTILGSGDVGIGTTTPGEKLDVIGNVQAVMFVSTSDKRLKKNIEKVNGLESIQKLDGVTWKWKESGEKDMGVIAQDVEKLFPWAVTTNKSTGYKAVKYDALIAPLIEATKELSLMCDRNSGYVEKIDRKLSSVDSKVEDLEKENKQLKNKVENLTKYLCERDPNAAFCR